jgi:flavin-dependent dehydrogenase
MGRTIPCDVAIVGGGLAGSLIALALQAKRPDYDVRIVEAGEAGRRSCLVVLRQRRGPGGSLAGGAVGGACLARL